MRMLKDALRRISYQLGRLGLPVADQLVGGLSLREINAKMKNFPLALTTELRTLYQWQNGCDEYNYEFFPSFYMLSLDEALSEYESLSRYECLGSKKWFPIFLHVMGAEYYYAELCDKKEKYASPVHYDFIKDADSSYMAYDSLTAMMLSIAECYETGAFYTDDEMFVWEYPAKKARIIARHNPKMIRMWLGEFGVGKVEDIVSFLMHADYNVSGRAAQALMVLLDEKTVMPVCELLRDKNPEVREMAARVLGELKDSRGVRPLSELLQDENERVRETARQSFEKIIKNA